MSISQIIALVFAIIVAVGFLYLIFDINLKNNQ